MSVKTLALDPLGEIIGDNSELNRITSELKGFDGDKIVLPIHSGGGAVFEGMAIYNYLRGRSSDVEVRIMGLAASMATVVSMSADKVVMADNGFFMIHDPIAFSGGNIDDHKQTLDLLKKIKNQAIDAYERKTKLPRRKISKMMSDETWLTAQEAYDLGFVDELSEGVKIEASIDLSQYKNVPKSIYNAIENTDNNEARHPNTERQDSEYQIKNSKTKIMEKFFNGIKSLFLKEGDEEITAEKAIENFMEKAAPAMVKLFAEEQAKAMLSLEEKISNTKNELSGAIDQVNEKLETVATVEALEAVVEENKSLKAKIEEFEAKIAKLEESQTEVGEIVAKAVSETGVSNTQGGYNITGFRNKTELKNETMSSKDLNNLLFG